MTPLKRLLGRPQRDVSGFLQAIEATYKSGWAPVNGIYFNIQNKKCCAVTASIINDEFAMSNLSEIVHHCSMKYNLSDDFLAGVICGFDNRPKRYMYREADDGYELGQQLYNQYIGKK